MKVVIYARVSTEEQAEEGKSIETQIRLCRKWAQDNQAEVSKVFVDEGKSATNLNRPSLQEMLALIQDDESIDAVLIQDTDRLARNTLDHLTLKSVLKKRGVKVVSVSQPMIDDSPEGSLVDTIIASVNTFQSQITGRKTSKVMEEKAKMGWFPGGTPPLGYKNALNHQPTSNLDKKIIAIDENHRNYVKEIFEKYASNRYALRDIADYLNSKGILSPRGNKIHVSFVANLLKDKFYLGSFLWKGAEYQGKHEPIIERELYEQVQRVMSAHNQNATRQRRHTFLLRGYAFCFTCKGKYTAEHHKKPSGAIYNMYFCQKCQRGSYIDRDKLENEVVKVFKLMKFSSQYVEKIITRAKELVNEYHTIQDSERTRLAREKNKIERGMKDAEEDRFINKTLDASMFAQVYANLQARLKGVDDQLTNSHVDHSKKIQVLDKLLTLAENIGEAYKTADYPLQRGYLALFIKKLNIKRGKIISYELSDALKSLIAKDVVLVRKNGLPASRNIRTEDLSPLFKVFQDTIIMGELKYRWLELQKIRGAEMGLLYKEV